MQDRTQRDITTNYRAELEQRMGVRPVLCEMAALSVIADQRKPYEVHDGIAIINISGVLTNDAWWWDETAYQDIQKEASQAADDAEVSGILLRVNSPGGETDNAFETARVLQAAGKKKPMWAVADNIAYSAGYLLAATASRIYVPRDTGGVGSIGVYSAHFDHSKALEAAGVKVTLTSAGKGKTDGNPYEPLSDAARKKIRGEVDRLYGLFTASVSAGRRMSEEAIREMGAALFIGASSAIESGLADKTGSYEDAWVALVEKTQKAQKSFVSMSQAGMKSNKEDPKMEPIETPAEAKAPDQTAVDIGRLTADAKASGYAEAEEIAELCELAGKSSMAVSFIKGKKTAADVRKELLEARATEAAEGGEISNASMPSTGATNDTKPAKSLKDLMAAKFKKEAA